MGKVGRGLVRELPLQKPARIHSLISPEVTAAGCPQSPLSRITPPVASRLSSARASGPGRLANHQLDTEVTLDGGPALVACRPRAQREVKSSHAHLPQR